MKLLKILYQDIKTFEEIDFLEKDFYNSVIIDNVRIGNNFAVSYSIKFRRKNKDSKILLIKKLFDLINNNTETIKKIDNFINLNRNQFYFEKSRIYINKSNVNKLEHFLTRFKTNFEPKINFDEKLFIKEHFKETLAIIFEYQNSIRVNFTNSIAELYPSVIVFSTPFGRFKFYYEFNYQFLLNFMKFMKFDYNKFFKKIESEYKISSLNLL